MKRRWNILIWAGFGVVLFALLSYIPLFALYPVTRDVPWANYLLFLAGLIVLGAGLRRAFRQPEQYRGKISGSILGVLSLLLTGFFCAGIYFSGKMLPPASTALQVGQPAPQFTLADTSGKATALADLLKGHRGVLLIFYRGYW